MISGMGVHCDKAVLYLALTMSRAKVEELGLGDVVPRWRKAGYLCLPTVQAKLCGSRSSQFSCLKRAWGEIVSMPTLVASCI